MNPTIDTASYAFMTADQKAAARNAPQQALPGQQTDAQRNAAITAAGASPAAITAPSITTPIAADTLTKKEPLLTPPLPQATTQTAIPDFSSLIADAEKVYQQSAEEKALMQQQTNLLQNLTSMPNASTINDQMSAKYDLAGKQTAADEAFKALKQKQAEYNAVRAQVNGQSTSATLQSFVDSRIQGIRQNMEPDLYMAAATYEAANGSLQSAQQNVDRAINLQFQDRQQYIDTAKMQLSYIQGAMERGEVRKTKTIELALKERDRILAQQEKELAQQKEDKKTIASYGLLAAKGNAPQDVIQRIMSAKTPEQALIAAGPYVVEEKKQTSYVDVGGRKLLVDDITGDVIADLGENNTATQTINQMTDNERALFGQFRGEQIVKDFNNIVGQKLAFDKVITNGVGGPADLAMVYMFMKGLDPTSVVRETEYATASQSGNIFQGIFAKYNGYLKEEGGFLPNNVKLEFQNLVNQRLSAQKMQYDNLKSQYSEMAKRQGMNPANVTLDYQAVLEGYNPTAPQAQSNDLDSFYLRATPEQRKTIEDLLQSSMSDEQIMMQVTGKMPEVPSGKTIKLNQGNIPKPALDLALSQIRKEEGLRLTAYQDQVGVWTIGYGNTMINGRPVKPGDRITRQQADEMLKDQAVNNYTNFTNYVTRDLTPKQTAALMSFEYNLGPSIWDKPDAQKIISLINNGDFKGASDKLQAYNTGLDQKTGKRKVLPVLVARRKREGALLNS